MQRMLFHTSRKYICRDNVESIEARNLGHLELIRREGHRHVGPCLDAGDVGCGFRQ